MPKTFDPKTRAELQRKAKELRGLGYPLRQIAKELGCSISTAWEFINKRSTEQSPAAVERPTSPVEHPVEHQPSRGRTSSRTVVNRTAEIDPTTLSPSAQAKLAAALRQHQRRLDATFEERVTAEIARRVEAIVLPAFREHEAEAELIKQSRRHGIFTRDEYNAILRCLHSDRLKAVDEAELDEAFGLFLAKRPALLSNKDDPRKYRGLPSVAEFMRGKA